MYLSSADAVAHAAIASVVCNAGLGFVTWRLASSTKKMADSGEKTADAAIKELGLLETQTVAAQQQGAVAEAALNASIQPLLVDVPPHTMMPRDLTLGELALFRNKPAGAPSYIETDASLITHRTRAGGDEKPYLEVPLRNIGPGVAIAIAARLARGPIEVWGDITANGVMRSAIAPSQVVTVVFGHQEPEPGWLEELLTSKNEALVVEITYTDISGRQETATRLDLNRDGDQVKDPFVVSQIYPSVPPALFKR